MGRFFSKLLLNLGKSCKTFRNTIITLFDYSTDSCYINVANYGKKNVCIIRLLKSSIAPN